MNKYPHTSSQSSLSRTSSPARTDARGAGVPPALAPSEAMTRLCRQIAFGIDPVAPDLFDGTASAVAAELNQQRQKECNKSTQLRRFYDEVVGWEQRLIDDKAFNDQQAFFRMLKAKVAYAFGRDRDERKGRPGLVDDNFRHWFDTCVDQTKSAEGLKHFRLHFEAMLGFLKALRA